jgi:hypothetical protein
MIPKECFSNNAGVPAAMPRFPGIKRYRSVDESLDQWAQTTQGWRNLREPENTYHPEGTNDETTWIF